MLTRYFAQRKFSLNSFKHSRLLTLVIALLVVSISLAFHEFWQDELEAPTRIHDHNWDIGALINSFRGDGHFPLYHLLIYPFLFVGNQLPGIDVGFILKFVTFIQYATLSLITIRWVRFPFSLLFLLSYYPLFEYGTISRCYLPGLILLLIIFRSILLKNQANRYLTIFACFLFPLTDVFYFIYSLPILIYCVVRKHWLKVSAFVASYPIAIFFLLPSSERSYSYFRDHPSPIQFVKNFVQFTLSAWIPFTTDIVWWNHSLATRHDLLNILFTIVVSVLVGLTLIRLYTLDPLLLLACCLGSGAIVAALVLKYPSGAFRHIGFAAYPFLCLLVLVYSNLDQNLDQNLDRRVNTKLNSLERSRSTEIPLDRLAYFAFVAVLSLQCFFGLAAVYKDTHDVFAFPAAQLKVLSQLREKSKRPEQFVFLAYPGAGASAVTALSNWQLKGVPVWSLATWGCVPTKQTTSPQTNSACPKNIFITTWAVKLQGFTNDDTKPFDYADKSFQASLLETYSGQSIGEFLRERSYKCRAIASFTDSQTVNEYIFRCRHKPSNS